MYYGITALCVMTIDGGVHTLAWTVASVLKVVGTPTTPSSIVVLVLSEPVLWALESLRTPRRKELNKNGE